ncbi:hypothetical protein BGZ63DRAFT_354464 [Mariannaea sp. PMI_226]|nr:hypothetical protein BGZ63DRAFT_354464 [Mariannaea sp. PMI_226]
MVAAAAAAANSNSNAGAHLAPPSSAPNLDPLLGAGDDDVVDDDSLNDPYGEIDQEDSSPQLQQPQPHEQDLPDSNDDYAKTFDSPIGPEEGEGEDIQPEDISSMHRESNQISQFSDHHLTNRPSEISHVVTESPSTAAQQPQSGSPAVTAAHTDEQPASASQPSNLDQAVSSTIDANSNSTDIQRLVADLTAHAEPNPSDDVSASKTEPVAGTNTSSALPSAASLPPRPPLPHVASQSYISQHNPSDSSSSVQASAAAPPTPGQPSTYVAAGAPGLAPDALGSLPAIAATGLNVPTAITSMTAPPYPPQTPAYATDRSQDADYQQQWDQFMADERQYMSEAKWDRFPEGSRIFIGTRSASGASKNGAHMFSTGNLSSDKVSKRDVFDMFHRFGRLAQISLKSAYGFVQYHTIEEGQRAMDNLQGIEIKGRRIHLEVSRVQDKSKKERNRSPERDRGRGRDSGRRNERYSQPQNRDDYRPGRNHSPRRNDYQRDEGYTRDRGYYDGGRGRGRSRSPSGYGRQDKDSYRRRSPSPHGRSRHDSDIDLPRRYGNDVPDVQIIQQPDVNRNFVGWVESAFKAKGLKSEVMIIHPRMPKDTIIQRQAIEGVHAVVDLDVRAQNLGRIPVQAFDRSAGVSNVRFDQYLDLDPSTAAEVILRAKASSSTAPYGEQHGQQPQYSAGGYPNPYGGQPQQHGGFPPPQYPQQAQPNATEITSLMGQIGQMDNAALQRLVSSIQNGSYGGPSQPGPGGAPVDIQAILGSLGGSQQQQAPQAYGNPYGAHPPNGGAPANGDAAIQVQNIMAQLARYRQ